MFDTPENELTKPYGVWMRAPLRKPTKLIGSRWLRDGSQVDQIRSKNSVEGDGVMVNQYPRNQEFVTMHGVNQGDNEDHNKVVGVNQASLKKIQSN